MNPSTRHNANRLNAFRNAVRRIVAAMNTRPRIAPASIMEDCNG